MALTNAERQKLYRQNRKEKVSELETLRNENAVLKAELEKYRIKYPEQRPIKPKFKQFNPDNALFYVEAGLLLAVLSNAHAEELTERGFSLIPASMIDIRFKRDVEIQMAVARQAHNDHYNKKAEAFNAWAQLNDIELAPMAQ